KYDVKATFFVIGKEDESCKKIVKTLYDKGHTVAPHTYSHVYGDIYSSVDSYLSDFDKIYNYVYDITNEKPTIFRFPGGSRNSIATNHGIMNSIIAEMDKRGLIFHDWNIVSGDDTPTVYPPETLFNNIIKGSKKTESPVILFHDTDYNKTTPQAVELVVKYFKEQGYEFDSIKSDTKPIQFAKKSY
ncbi:MAG: polysaccharide deacetylase family protein, partial [Oscillospiraceae bacterium]